MQEPRYKRPGEDAFGILVLLIGLVLAWQSYEISGFAALSSPGAFPMAVSAAMVLGSLIVVIGNIRRNRATPKPAGEKARANPAGAAPSVIVVFAACVAGYAALLDTLGFLPASFLFLFAAIQFLHRRSVAFSVGVALLSLALIYALFRLVFTVVLPEGIIPEREILAWIERLLASAGP